MTFTSALSALSAVLSAFAIPGSIAGLAAIAAAAGLLLVLVACQVHGASADPAAYASRIPAAGLRDRSRRTARLRLRDPNSAGRSRPRAPSPAQAAW